MLTVRKIGVTVGDAFSAARAARYSLERADAPDAFDRGRYYTAAEAGLPEGAPNAFWLGTAATLERLGVARGTEVLEEELTLALQGRHAQTGEQLRRPGYRSVPAPAAEQIPGAEPRMVREARINNVDLTFSAPKSVSVVWSQAGPELRRDIERAMLAAADAGLGYMMSTKPVVQGARTPAAGYAASAALQVTARTATGDRVPAPQLHVHGVVVGVAGEDGRLRTPDTAALFKHDAPLEGGAVFRAVLAERLRGLGFVVDWGTGRNSRFFELRGVPQGLIERMSPRAREVERLVAEIEAATGERLTGERLGAVAMHSRTAKAKEVTAEQIMRAWDAHAREFGFGPETVEGLRARDRGPGRPLAALREQARAAVLARIWEQGPTVSVGAARAIAFEVAPLGLTVGQAAELLVDMQRAGELIALEGRRVTTMEIRAAEQKVLGAATAAAAREAEPVAARAVAAGIAAADRSLGEGRTLDAEQLQAVERLTAGGGWGMLTGRAGTGKGPVLQAVAHAHRADGWSVVAAAVDGATAQRLGHQVEAQALTIDQVAHRVAQGTLAVGDRTLILIDEAGKVGLRGWEDVARLSRAGARVVAIGHAGQLGAIELPGMFEALLGDDGIPSAELSVVRRHRDPADPSREHPWLGRYQGLLDEGRGAEAIALLREREAITMHAGREEAIEALVDGWDARRRQYGDARDAILVVHGSNADVDRVNALAQDRRRAAGEVGGAGVRAVDREYALHAGDVVMLREAAFAPAAGWRVENGTIGVVVGVDAERDAVRVALSEPGAQPRVVDVEQGPARRRIERGEERVPALRLAYAFHPFPLQGATVKDVGVLAGHWSQDKEGTYTADTRAQLALRVHVDRESLGADGTDDDRFARYARRVRTSQERAASVTLAPEDAALGVRVGGRERAAE
ncbi:MAG TPA: MobF family relaxase, partial [Baekduia sp.]|nr:MobF family relaxase [Baekduia sp.]